MTKDDHPYYVLPVHYVNPRGKQKHVHKPREFLQEEQEVEESFNHRGFLEFYLFPRLKATVCLGSRQPPVQHYEGTRPGGGIVKYLDLSCHSFRTSPFPVLVQLW